MIKPRFNPHLPIPLLRPFLIPRSTFHHPSSSRPQSSSSSTTPSRQIGQRFNSSSRSICPTCSTPLPPTNNTIQPFCSSCSTLLPPPPPSSSSSSTSITAYKLFSLPPVYKLNSKELKTRYLKWQQLVHPDLFSATMTKESEEEEGGGGGGGGGGEKLRWAREWSRIVNEGYRTLEGYRSRGEYLLELNGISIEETEGITDPELLMKIMETREELEEATTESAVDLIRSSNLEEIQKVVQELEIVFDEIKPPDLLKAKSLVMKLRYLDNVEGVCREWTPSKGRIEIIH